MSSLMDVAREKLAEAQRVEQACPQPSNNPGRDLEAMASRAREAHGLRMEAVVAAIDVLLEQIAPLLPHGGTVPAQGLAQIHNDYVITRQQAEAVAARSGVDADTTDQTTSEVWPLYPEIAHEIMRALRAAGGRVTVEDLAASIKTAGPRSLADELDDLGRKGLIHRNGLEVELTPDGRKAGAP